MPNPSRQIETQLLTITASLLKELKQDRALRALSLDADLEQQLGIGSLEKAELLRRIEMAFDIQLNESLLANAATLRALVEAVGTANPHIAPSTTRHYPTLPDANIHVSASSTLTQVLEQYARQTPDRPHIYLQNDRGEESVIAYGQLHQAAQGVATQLLQRRLQPKQTVAIMLPSGEDFFYTFFGVLIAGGIPVPIYPPFRANKLEEYMRREATILNNAHCQMLITFPEVKTLSRLLQSFVPELHHVLVPEDLRDETQSAATLASPTLTADDAALIQYTSGSTGDPKGVLLSHKNLLENIKAYGEAIEVKPTDSVVSWLPLYHDMGLIGAWLGSLYFGVPVTILSPLSFLTHPEKWLWTIHYHRATLSVAPNFAYELLLSKVPDKKLKGLDLSSWRLALNGAEAIYPNTLRRFYQRFKKYGLSEHTQCPVYGLAENAVGLSCSDIHREPVIDRINRLIFDTERRAEPLTSENQACHEFVNCGKPIPRHEVRIVDDQGIVLPDRAEGRLQFRGPSMMQGYFEQPEATAQITHDGWYDTGDFAYLVDGDIYITGREKDVIIKAGRNLYPQEIEEIVGDLDNVRKGCIVAFGVRNPKRGTEQFIIVAESHASEKNQRHAIQSEIVEHVATSMGIPPDDVVIAPPGTVLKTSSGKLQRSATKKAYMEGKLIKRSMPAHLQILRIATKSLWQRSKTALTTLFCGVYTVYVGVLATLILVPLFPVLRWAPSHFNRQFARQFCRLILLLAFCPIKRHNRNIIHTKKSLIYVANHASYMDAVLLIATLPPNVLYVGKQELLEIPIVGGYFKACGYLTIDRMDFHKSLEDMEKIKTALNRGQSIMLFPEGTFAYATGIRPFKLGAFNLAIQSGVPLCTIGLRGTRQLLRAYAKCLIPSKLSIHFGSILEPENQEFHEAVRLRELSRAEICTLSGEKPINLVRAGPDEQ